MKYKVKITAKAVEMISSNIQFLAKADINAAEKLRKRIKEQIHSLAEMPQRNPYFNEFEFPHNKYRKLFVANWFLIIYQIEKDTVFVDYVIDCRQDYNWL